MWKCFARRSLGEGGSTAVDLAKEGVLGYFDIGILRYSDIGILRYCFAPRSYYEEGGILFREGGFIEVFDLYIINQDAQQCNRCAPDCKPAG